MSVESWLERACRPGSQNRGVLPRQCESPTLAMEMPRRRKSAGERRAQYLRSEARMVQRLLRGFTELHLHRGSQASVFGRALEQLLRGDGRAPHPHAKAGMDEMSSGASPVRQPASAVVVADSQGEQEVPATFLEPAVDFPAMPAVKRPKRNSRASAWEVVGSPDVAKVHVTAGFVSRVSRSLALGDVVRGTAVGPDALGLLWVELVDGSGYVAVSTAEHDFPGLGRIRARSILQEVPGDVG